MAAKRPPRYDVYVDDVNFIRTAPNSKDGKFILYKDFLKWEAEQNRDKDTPATGRRAALVNRAQGAK